MSRRVRAARCARPVARRAFGRSGFDPVAHPCEMSVSRTDAKVFSGSPSLSISLCFMSASQQVGGERGRDDDGVLLGLMLMLLS